MKNSYSIFLQAVLSVLLISSFAFAAPAIDDGFMSYTSDEDWGGLGDSTVTAFPSGFDSTTPLTNVSVEEGFASGGEPYDVEELGLYIDDNILYIGIQTNFDLEDGVGDIAPGDFIFNFDESSNTFSDNSDADDFAFSFNINNGSVDMILLGGTMGGGSDTTINNYGNKDWEIISQQYSQEFIGAGQFTQGNHGDEGGYYNGYYTLEAAIDLGDLQGELLDIFTSFESTSVTMYWQPSCGNDFLAARSDFSFTPNDELNHTPEPATLLLFGMGLLGAGAYGRKKQIKEEK